MNHEYWRILNLRCPSSTPIDGQDIYFSISEGEGRPFPPAAQMKANITAFQDLLTLNPDWMIIWQPAPPIPTPPQDYIIGNVLQCIGNLQNQTQCEFYDCGDCLLCDDSSVPVSAPCKIIIPRSRGGDSA